MLNHPKNSSDMAPGSPSRWHFFWFSSPKTFYPLAGKLIPFFAALAAVLCAIGLYISFFVAPTDAQQGDAYRIIFIHVPAAWMSMFLYVVMACWAALGLVLNTRMSAMMASAIAPTGALFTFIALWKTHMGNVVGLGCPAHLRTHPAVSVFRIHGPRRRH
jgi:heme exporter protein C